MLFVVFQRLGQAIRRGWEDPVFRSLMLLSLTLLVGGSFLFHRVEGWTYFQAFYFCVITLTTVGYGDFSPHTFRGRLFTIFYVLIGVGIIVALVTRIASLAAEARLERRERREERKRQSGEGGA
ncbi:MAG: potassium channel family protein [Actinobacteria bacterium]|nr:potassium channel family protein [Actinomycetota bacterium]